MPRRGPTPRSPERPHGAHRRGGLDRGLRRLLLRGVRLLTEEAQTHRSLRTASPPPASEDIHLPTPSYLPVVVAASITIALVGVVLSWVAFVLGLVVLLVAVIVWIRKARAEVAELPLGH